MGWKALKDAFDIKHCVAVDQNHIIIGSGYISDIVKIHKETGRVVVNSSFPSFLREKYPLLEKASPDELLALINAEDVFTSSIPVYTYEGAEIIEKLCEEPGYPNVTHDGQIMYQNTFSTDKDQVVAWAKRSAFLYAKNLDRHINEREQELTKTREKLTAAKSDIASLDAAYPKVLREE